MNDATIIASLQRENDALRAQVEQLRRLRSFASFFDEKARWSRETFGDHRSHVGVVAHIRKELLEIEQRPSDLVEWCDVVLLAMDGAWRSAGADGAAFFAALRAKFAELQTREWPPIGATAPDAPIEHVRTSADALQGAARAPSEREQANEWLVQLHDARKELAALRAAQPADAPASPLVVAVLALLKDREHTAHLNGRNAREWTAHHEAVLK